KGFGSAENSWEHEDDLNCPDLIQAFHKKLEEIKQIGEKDLRVREKGERKVLARTTFDFGRRGLRQEARRMTYYDMDED
ncbi:unnamed protein product, partial [Cyprideis torosa]